MKIRYAPFLAMLLLAVFAACQQPGGQDAVKEGPETAADRKLVVTGNKRFLAKANGKGFFWLGDTGWLLFRKLDRKQAELYLDTRKKQGFNVIQVMVIHELPQTNTYGDAAVAGTDVSKPITTPGNNPNDSLQYDYWDHVDYIIDLAAKKGIYMALVPIWGSNVKGKKVTPAQAAAFAGFLAKRYHDRWNIIWLNGGDIKGTDGKAVWDTVGTTLRQQDTTHLITFHPRGRTTSSLWFHDAPWLDFNMSQSGHRRYDQDTSAREKLHYGEDNWKYIDRDYAMVPKKPTIDGEPSYEGIPHGLHDTTERRWTAADVRRYGYWSVLAGGFGYTYGHNSVMQFYKKGDKASYGPKENWDEAMNSDGARQMTHLRTLMETYDFVNRQPDQSLVAGRNGDKYERVVVSRHPKNILAYTYTGKTFSLNMGALNGETLTVSWFDPKTGKITKAADVANTGVQQFDPPGDPANGNDRVLILEAK